MRSEALYLDDIIAVHQYFGVSWETVWNTAMQDVPILRERIAAILAAEFPDEG